MTEARADAPPFTPLLASLIARHGWRVVDLAALDALAPSLGPTMLFLPGDGTRLAESNDAAVVLAELDKALDHRVTPLVADRRDERALQRRYRFTAFPALVFLRAGGYLGCIERVLDWDDYLRRIPEILAAEPRDPPPFAFPEHCAPPAGDPA